MTKEARYWTTEGDKIRCGLCPNRCLIALGRRGRCHGRGNRGGRLSAINYGVVVSMGTDPIEKKPLYHFHPGQDILSVATYGCSLHCPFCQNCEISQREVEGRYLSPEQLAGRAEMSDGLGIAYTYTEPLIWFEYLLDVMPLVRRAGQKNVLVTNGMIEPEPLAELLPWVDAMNIDLKSADAVFYRDVVGGDLDAVKRTIDTVRGRCHVELTTLLIPGRNDSDDDVSALVDYVAGLGRQTVLHLSRYFPRHRATEPPTPIERMLRAAEIAAARLDYVYLGNVAVEPRWRDTKCPRCGSLLVDRAQYAGRVVGVTAGLCGNCHRPVDLVL